jgi:CDP-glucose 4,6-dehydratase
MEMSQTSTLANNGIIEPGFWNGKRVFLTGHTGFKGVWLSLWLTQLGATVKGFSLPPEDTPNMFSALDMSSRMESVFGDIRDHKKLEEELVGFDPDIVYHLAAQPLVRKSYQEPVETFETNVIGTANLLDCCRTIKFLKSVLVVTTDKVYRNNEWCWPYREEDSLGGHDPYSASKAAAELVVQAYSKSFFHVSGQARLVTMRAGNIIGGGDWSVDRLLPDCVRAVSTGQSLEVRSPTAIRPWQHVTDALKGYLLLAQHLEISNSSSATAFNFGPSTDTHYSVRDILQIAQECWQGNLDWHVAEVEEKPHEAGTLMLDSALARKILKWQPSLNSRDAVRATVEWHTHFDSSPSDIVDMTLSQIAQSTDS